MEARDGVADLLPVILELSATVGIKAELVNEESRNRQQTISQRDESGDPQESEDGDPLDPSPCGQPLRSGYGFAQVEPVA